MKKTFLLLTLVIALFNCNDKLQQNDVTKSIENNLLPQFVKSLDSLPFMNIEDRLKYYNVPGISYCVIENDNIITSNTFGYSDVTNKFKVDSLTLFQSASTGKTLTATVALILVSEGFIELDKDVNTYLNTWKIPKSGVSNTPITLRMLLSHTSGLSTHGFDGYKKTDALPNIAQILNGESPANSEKVVRKIKPNTKWQYSGGGYQVIQLLIEDVVGKPFTEVATEKLLKPLELKNTIWKTILPQKFHKKASKEYYKGNKELEGGWYNLASNGAGGGLWTTPNDLAKFIITLNKSKTKNTSISISQQLANEMQLKQSPDKEFGLGLFLDNNTNYNAIYHSGGNMGFRTMMYYLPKSKQGIVIMANSDNALYLIPEIMRAASYVYKWPSYKPVLKQTETLSSKLINEAVNTSKFSKLREQLKPLMNNELNKRNIYNELSDIGASQYQIWKTENAIALFEINKRFFSDSLNTYINLGMAYRRNENYKMAKVVFENGLKIDSTESFLKQKISEIKNKINQ